MRGRSSVQNEGGLGRGTRTPHKARRTSHKKEKYFMFVQTCTDVNTHPLLHLLLRVGLL